MSQWDRRDLGPFLGYLPQDIELFEGSLAENISRFGELNAEKIIAASKTAVIHEMILTLPKGYDTQIGPNSGALSAGQRQKVGLARALFNKPKLVVLDEPNSNLDDQGEKDLTVAISQLKAVGTTVIIITHRTSILSLVDKLLFLQDGMAKAFGPKDQVLQVLKDERPKVAQLKPKR